ncbi:MAG: ATP-dependent zinc metalloprotease FtsH, partial [Elusimicrobiaceae bacterium]|nr:ATP-dependent zinc metalloprotease FtsH [Elusimicrobiaceae bacterium]
IKFLKNPKKFQKLGGKLPKGILLYGAPGTGKTLLAKAVAGEAGVAFFSASASEFVEMFVGVGAARVRDLFDQAKKNSPAIIFIDELDAVGRRRFAGIGGGHDEREQTLNQLLIELDGFESKQGIILMASTNRPDVLDPALVRPGRFDRHVSVPAPDLKGREEILKVHAKKVKLAPEVDLKTIAKGTPGVVGADLANVINEAAILAARADKDAVDNADMDEAVERVIAGPQKKSRIISEKEKRIIAAHEVGHTLVARLTDHSDPVHKVTIIPRGQALGYTLQLPLEDKFLTSKSEILDRICIFLAGRVAEEISFGEITSGASDDLNKATAYARKMITELGMSDKIGPIALPSGEEGEVFLGRDFSRHRQYSEDLARRIDAEISDTLQGAYARAKEIITSHRAQFDTLVERLLEKEVVEAAEIDEILGFAPAKKEEEPVQTSEKEETASQEKTEPKKEDKNEENKAPEQPQLF